jgi:hypothetical protein
VDFKRQQEDQQEDVQKLFITNKVLALVMAI